MADQNLGTRACASTPLGALSLAVSGSPAASVRLIDVAPPDLPEGMAVDGVMLFHVLLEAPVGPDCPVFLRVFADEPGDSETGERLESIGFRSGKGVLQAAMRDKEWLAAEGVCAEWAEYGPHGMEQKITQAAAGYALHVGVAWRLAGPALPADDVSTWFAADLILPGRTG